MLIIANNQLDSSCSEINIKYDEVNVQTYANASNIIGFGYGSIYSLCFYWVGTWEGWQRCQKRPCLWRKATKIPPGVSRLLAPGVIKLTWRNSMQMYSILIHFRGLHNSLCSHISWFQQLAFWNTCYVCREHVRNAIPT